MAEAVANALCTHRAVPDPQWLRTFPGDDERASGNSSRRQRRWNRLDFLRIQMETGRCKSRAALVRAASTAIGLANVVRGPRWSATRSMVRKFHGSLIAESTGRHAIARTQPISR